MGCAFRSHFPYRNTFGNRLLDGLAYGQDTFFTKAAGHICLYKYTSKLVYREATVWPKSYSDVEINRSVLLAVLNARRHSLPRCDQPTVPLRFEGRMFNADAMSIICDRFSRLAASRAISRYSSSLVTDSSYVATRAIESLATVPHNILRKRARSHRLRERRDDGGKAVAFITEIAACKGTRRIPKAVVKYLL